MTHEQPINGVPAYLEKLAKQIIDDIEYLDGETQNIDSDVQVAEDDAYVYASVTVQFRREQNEYTQRGYEWVIADLWINELTLYSNEDWPLEQRAFLSNLKAFAQC